MDQQQKAAKFRGLHQQTKVFVMPNPWDVGSARILASMGFQALATTSSGFAHSLGLNDGAVNREQVLQHCKTIVEATDLPVSADLESGYGDRPEKVAETIKMAAAVGLAGGSIEDYSNDPSNPIIEFQQAVERIHAAVECKNNLLHDFILTARCENHVWDSNDLDDTIKRLQAYEQVGADVLYAPGLQDVDHIRLVCESLSKPVNVVIEMANTRLAISDLAAAGAKRISIGSVLFLTAYGALFRAAGELQQFGTFNFVSDRISFDEIEDIFTSYSSPQDSLKKMPNS